MIDTDNGRITISRPVSNFLGDSIQIEIRGVWPEGEELIRVSMTLEEFSMAITGGGRRPCSIKSFNMS